MKIKPLQDWAVIRPNMPAEKTASGLYIPDAAQEKPQQGEVIAVGEGRFKEERDRKGKVKDKTFIKTVLKPGDRVLYEKYSGTKIEVDNEEFVMVREEDVLGYIH